MDCSLDRPEQSISVSGTEHLKQTVTKLLKHEKSGCSSDSSFGFVLKHVTSWLLYHENRRFISLSALERSISG